MGKQFVKWLISFLPIIAFGQVKNSIPVEELYRQIDSLEFSIFRTRDSINRVDALTKIEISRLKNKFELYRELARLETKGFNNPEGTLLKIRSVDKDSAGVVLQIFSIEVEEETVASIIGDYADVQNLFNDFPNLRKQYSEQKLLVEVKPRLMQFFSPKMDLPSIPKMPKDNSAQAKKILADRLLHWMQNACFTLNCEHDLSLMLQDEKKSRMNIDQVIAGRKLFIDVVISEYSKHHL